MDELNTTPAPEPSATPPVESTPSAEGQPRAPDGKFAPKEGASLAETPSAPTESTETETEQPEKDDLPKRNRVSERINQLTAEKHAAQREAAALRARIESLQQARPSQVDPNDYEAVQREGMRQVIREETAQQTVQQYQDAVGRAYQAAVDTFRMKIDAARERIPDIDRSVQDFMQLPVSQHAAEVIADSEFSAEIAHYLAHNPGEAHRIHMMTPAQQGRELARIESKVSLPVKKTTKAPPPPPTVTGAQPARQKTPQEESTLEYMERRQKELNGRGR
jgi:hypothetical protein